MVRTIARMAATEFLELPEASAGLERRRRPVVGEFGMVFECRIDGCSTAGCSESGSGESYEHSGFRDWQLALAKSEQCGVASGISMAAGFDGNIAAGGGENGRSTDDGRAIALRKGGSRRYWIRALRRERKQAN